jgi:hypothetical protein
MPSTLAQLEARVGQFLMDAAAAVWPTTTIDEGLRLALQEYTQSNPSSMESVVDVLAAGREIALDSLADLLDVTEVWWPFDSTVENWPPNRVAGFRLWWDDARPVLHLTSNDGSQPQAGDELRVWYTVPQTIQNLDAADMTTLRTVDDTLIVLGAAGHCCFSRSADLAENAATSTTATPNYAALGSRFLKEFRYLLAKLRPASPMPPGASPFGAGWALDAWDSGER